MEIDVRRNVTVLLASGGVAIGVLRVARQLWQRRIDAFGAKFDGIYAHAAEDAEENWEDIEKLKLLDLEGPLKIEHLEPLMGLRATYLWYYGEHATRGAWLQWSAMALPLRVRMRGRAACMASLFAEHREAHERLKKVRDDLRAVGVPDFYMQASLRDTLAPA